MKHLKEKLLAGLSVFFLGLTVLPTNVIAEETGEQPATSDSSVCEQNGGHQYRWVADESRPYTEGNYYISWTSPKFNDGQYRFYYAEEVCEVCGKKSGKTADKYDTEMDMVEFNLPARFLGVAWVEEAGYKKYFADDPDWHETKNGHGATVYEKIYLDSGIDYIAYDPENESLRFEGSLYQYHAATGDKASEFYRDLLTSGKFDYNTSYFGDFTLFLDYDMDTEKLIDEATNTYGYLGRTGVMLTLKDEHVHDMQFHEAKEATCSNSGNVAYCQCLICNKYFEDEEGEQKIDSYYINLLPHKYVWETVSEPTEDENGYMHEVCTVCGEEGSGKTLPAANHVHDMQFYGAEEATCDFYGNQAYYYCNECGNYYKDEDGKVDTTWDEISIVNLGHQYEWKTVKEATGEEDGLEVEICSRCDDQRNSRVLYKIIEGNDLVLVQEKEATFRSNAAFNKFSYVTVDGKKVDASNYDVKEGSTIVTLKPDFVKSLAVGKHELVIYSSDGYAGTAFEVKASSKPVTPTNSTTPSKPTTQAASSTTAKVSTQAQNTTKVIVPNTGVKGRSFGGFAAAVLAGIAVVLVSANKENK